VQRRAIAVDGFDTCEIRLHQRDRSGPPGVEIGAQFGDGFTGDCLRLLRGGRRSQTRA
jgi:hypothetical protein